MIKIRSLLLLSLALCLLFCTHLPLTPFSDDLCLLHRGSVHPEIGPRPGPHHTSSHPSRPLDTHSNFYHHPLGQGHHCISEHQAIVYLGVHNPCSRPILRCDVTSIHGQWRREGHYPLCQVPQSRRGRIVSEMLEIIMIYCLDYILI